MRIGDIIKSEDARWYGLITKHGVTDRMVYVIWFHDDLKANGWFPINILIKVSQ